MLGCCLLDQSILNYVVMLSKEKSFTKAARKLHLSQPSLSYQILKLEKELGVDLFIREQNQVLLSHAGKVFLSYAIPILDQMEQLKNEIADISEVKNDKLALGSLTITGAYILPKAISLFRKKYPGITFKLIEDSSINLQTMIVNGEIELAITSLPINKNLETELIIEEDVYLAIPKNHWLSNYNEVDLSICKDESFIFINQGDNSREMCLQAGFEPNVVLGSTNIDTCQTLVTTGLGVSFVPKMCIMNTSIKDRPIYLPLTINGTKAKRKVVVIYKNNRYLSKSSRKFIEVLKSMNS
jgi:LysR family transcriptional regulator, hydrogen peroxide-inducible genes activator